MPQIDLNRCFPAATDGSHSPLPKQDQFLRASLDAKGAKFVAYVGGVGCLRADQTVLTATGPVPIAELTASHQVETVGSYAQGILAFPSVRGSAYRVRHTHGEFVASGSHLVFCSDHRYRPVSDLGGSALAYLPPTTRAPSLPAYALDVPRLTQIASDWLDRCLAYSRQYGQLPRAVLDIALAFAPSLAGAPECVRSAWSDVCARVDVLTAREYESSHLGQLCDLLASSGYGFRLAAQESGAPSQASALSSEPSLPASPADPQALLKIVSHLQSRLNPDNYTYAPPPSVPSQVLDVTKLDDNTVMWDLTIPVTECYVGNGILHHNSGKTVVGCATVISWAVLYGGDYLICRQFAPELRDTTLKTFLEICPRELILEHRVADGIVRLASASGEPATILFRQLEDPDKLRSLNLSGFYVDEANQVSEAAFMLLQGRLRNVKGLRKGVLTSNPKGHDWIYRWFVKKDHLKNSAVKAQFSLVHAPSTENVHLPEGYVETMLATWSDERVQREVMGSFDSFEGAVYPEFRRDVHVIKPFAIPEGWTRVVGADHGFRNPAAWVWGAVDHDGNLYVYREFYETEWLIKEICREGKDGRLSAPGRMAKGEKLQALYIDPATGARRGADGRSDLDWYLDYLPKDIVVVKANNAVEAGIDRVKSLLKIDEKTGKPRMYFFDTCINTIEELTNYRYAELRPNQEGKRNEREIPLKANDHAVDGVRYLAMSLPETTKKPEDVYDKIKYNSIEGALYRDIQSLKKGKKQADPFGDQ